MTVAVAQMEVIVVAGRRVVWAPEMVVTSGVAALEDSTVVAAAVEMAEVATGWPRQPRRMEPNHEPAMIAIYQMLLDVSIQVGLLHGVCSMNGHKYDTRAYGGRSAQRMHSVEVVLLVVVVRNPLFVQ